MLPFVVLSLFAIPGIATLAYNLYLARLANTAKSWPSVVGTVELVQLVNHAGGRNRAQTSEVLVEYPYSVRDQSFRNDRIAYGYSASGAKRANENLKEHLERSGQVKVRYNPSNPADSCLSFGRNHGIRFGISLSIAWLIACSLFAVLFYLQRTDGQKLIRHIELVRQDVAEEEAFNPSETANGRLA